MRQEQSRRKTDSGPPQKIGPSTPVIKARLGALSLNNQVGADHFAATKAKSNASPSSQVGAFVRVGSSHSDFGDGHDEEKVGDTTQPLNLSIVQEDNSPQSPLTAQKGRDAKGNTYTAADALLSDPIDGERRLKEVGSDSKPIKRIDLCTVTEKQEVARSLLTIEPSPTSPVISPESIGLEDIKNLSLYDLIKVQMKYQQQRHKSTKVQRKGLARGLESATQSMTVLPQASKTKVARKVRNSSQVSFEQRSLSRVQTAANLHIKDVASLVTGTPSRFVSHRGAAQQYTPTAKGALLCDARPHQVSTSRVSVRNPEDFQVLSARRPVSKTRGGVRQESAKPISGVKTRPNQMTHERKSGATPLSLSFTNQKTPSAAQRLQACIDSANKSSQLLKQKLKTPSHVFSQQKKTKTLSTSVGAVATTIRPRTITVKSPIRKPVTLVATPALAPVASSGFSTIEQHDGEEQQPSHLMRSFQSRKATPNLTATRPLSKRMQEKISAQLSQPKARSTATKKPTSQSTAMGQKNTFTPSSSLMVPSRIKTASQQKEHYSVPSQAISGKTAKRKSAVPTRKINVTTKDKTVCGGASSGAATSDLLSQTSSHLSKALPKKKTSLRVRKGSEQAPVTLKRVPEKQAIPAKQSRGATGRGASKVVNVNQSKPFASSGQVSSHARQSKVETYLNADLRGNEALDSLLSEVTPPEPQIMQQPTTPDRVSRAQRSRSRSERVLALARQRSQIEGGLADSPSRPGADVGEGQSEEPQSPGFASQPKSLDEAILRTPEATCVEQVFFQNEYLALGKQNTNVEMFEPGILAELDDLRSSRELDKPLAIERSRKSEPVAKTTTPSVLPSSFQPSPMKPQLKGPRHHFLHRNSLKQVLDGLTLSSISDIGRIKKPQKSTQLVLQLFCMLLWVCQESSLPACAEDTLPRVPFQNLEDEFSSWDNVQAFLTQNEPGLFQEIQGILERFPLPTVYVEEYLLKLQHKMHVEERALTRRPSSPTLDRLLKLVQGAIDWHCKPMSSFHGGGGLTKTAKTRGEERPEASTSQRTSSVSSSKLYHNKQILKSRNLGANNSRVDNVQPTLGSRRSHKSRNLASGAGGQQSETAKRLSKSKYQQPHAFARPRPESRQTHQFKTAKPQGTSSSALYDDEDQTPRPMLHSASMAVIERHPSQTVNDNETAIDLHNFKASVPSQQRASRVVVEQNRRRRSPGGSTSRLFKADLGGSRYGPLITVNSFQSASPTSNLAPKPLYSSTISSRNKLVAGLPKSKTTLAAASTSFVQSRTPCHHNELSENLDEEGAGTQEASSEDEPINLVLQNGIGPSLALQSDQAKVELRQDEASAQSATSMSHLSRKVQDLRNEARKKRREWTDTDSEDSFRIEPTNVGDFIKRQRQLHETILRPESRARPTSTRIIPANLPSAEETKQMIEDLRAKHLSRAIGQTLKSHQPASPMSAARSAEEEEDEQAMDGQSELSSADLPRTCKESKSLITLQKQVEHARPASQQTFSYNEWQKRNFANILSVLEHDHSKVASRQVTEDSHQEEAMNTVERIDLSSAELESPNKKEDTKTDQ